MAGMGRHAVHRTIVVVDVEGYSSASRTLPHQLRTRAGMYAVLAEALAAAGVPKESCHHGDAGDGVVVLVPPEYPKGPLVEVLPEALARAVRGHNSISPDAARARLRLAVHAGEVAFDEHGATSPAMVAAFRLLDAAPAREALAGSPGVLALVVSGLVFDEVVRNSTTLDPATFRPVEVAVKSFRDRAWVALPDHPYPADPAALDQQPPTSTPAPAPDGRARTGRSAEQAPTTRKTSAPGHEACTSPVVCTAPDLASPSARPPATTSPSAHHRLLRSRWTPASRRGPRAHRVGGRPAPPRHHPRHRPARRHRGDHEHPR